MAKRSKTHSGAGKRFLRTGNGKLKRRKAFRNHILTKKSPKQKRQLRVNGTYVARSDVKSVVRMLRGS